MVNIGTINRKIVTRLCSVLLYAGFDDNKLFSTKKIPAINKKVPIKIYPIADVK